MSNWTRACAVIERLTAERLVRDRRIGGAGGPAPELRLAAGAGEPLPGGAGGVRADARCVPGGRSRRPRIGAGTTRRHYRVHRRQSRGAGPLRGSLAIRRGGGGPAPRIGSAGRAPLSFRATGPREKPPFRPLSGPRRRSCERADQGFVIGKGGFLSSDGQPDLADNAVTVVMDERDTGVGECLRPAVAVVDRRRLVDQPQLNNAVTPHRPHLLDVSSL